MFEANKSSSRSSQPPALAMRFALGAAMLALLGVSALRVHADENQPVFTSPIDVTRGKLQLLAIAPDRDTGEAIDRPLPVDLVGPKMSTLMNTPLGTQMDTYWGVTPDPKTGRTPRQDACDGEKGIKAQVEQQIRTIGADFSAYDISCDLATSGVVLTENVGGLRYLSYQLFNNNVEFYVTTPATCHRDHGTFLCPDDPKFTVTFASEIWTTVRTPALCQTYAGEGTVNLHAVQIDTHNFSGDVARNIVDTLFLGNKFSAAELAIESAQQQVPLPLDDSLTELRDSAPCTDRGNPEYAAAASFSEAETTVEGEDVVIRVIHPAIAAPRFQNVSLPYGPDTCAQGFVWRDAFAGDRACVDAGDTCPGRRRQRASRRAARTQWWSVRSKHVQAGLRLACSARRRSRLCDPGDPVADGCRQRPG